MYLYGQKNISQYYISDKMCAIKFYSIINNDKLLLSFHKRINSH